MTDYALEFRTLVAKSAWNLEALFDAFLHGLSEEIKDELAAQELPLNLDSLIAITIRIDGARRERRSERRLSLGNICSSAGACSPLKESGGPRSVHFREEPKPPEFPRESLATSESVTPEPMQLGRAGLSPRERSHRLSTNSCLFCGAAGQYI